MAAADPFRCICNPDDLFEPPDPMPRAVKGCPAHQARYAAQQFAQRLDRAEAHRDVLAAVRDGLVFYDYFDHRYVVNELPGEMTSVTDAVQLLEDCGLIHKGTASGGDMELTKGGEMMLEEKVL